MSTIDQLYRLIDEHIGNGNLDGSKDGLTQLKKDSIVKLQAQDDGLISEQLKRLLMGTKKP